MDLKLAGDVAVVIGGARGLGLAIAEAFAGEDASVVLIDREQDVSQIAARIPHARESIGLVADVTDNGQIETAARRIQERMGRVDHVVFAAGIGSGKFGFPFWNLDPADWENVLRVNLLGGMHVAHAFAPRMAEARRGTMLFLSSVAGQIGSQTDPPYSASKAGLINFAQCAAKDLAPFGVRVNTLCPGMVRTALNRSVFEAWAARTTEPKPPSYEEWAAEKIAKLVPLGRWQEVEDIAAMAVFLASPRAGNITGQTINVDGGYVMHW